MAKKSKKPSNPNLIVANRKARHDYDILEDVQAGIALEGWEVKALRAGRCQLTDSHVIIRRGEAWLIGMHINPLESTSNHKTADPTRTRKLLLQKKELDKLTGAVERKGLTLIALNLSWKKHWVKVRIALAKGRKTHDKRQALKDRDWQRQQQRVAKGQRD